MRILVSEFITGGGMVGEILPASLQREGNMMLSAIVSDLAQLPDVELLVTCDRRCVADQFPDNTEIYFIDKNYLPTFENLCEKVDAVLPIAPEQDGVLEILSKQVLEKNKLLLGSEPDVIKLTASKKATAEFLADHNIPVIETKFVGKNITYDHLPKSESGWIVKPDQGVGCDQVTVCASEAAVSMAALQCESAIVQPFYNGRSVSLSLLCNRGESVSIGYNEQMIEYENNRLKYVGSKVNAVLEYAEQLNRLAGLVAAALPTLRGYVGMDVIINESAITVVEINPRMTTSYVGLSQSINLNPAKLILDIFQKNKLPTLDHSDYKMITVRL